MDSKFSYLDYFKTDFLILKISGCWILDGLELPTGFSLYFIVVNFLINGMVNFCMATYLVLKANSLQKIAALGLVILTCIMGTVRVFFLFTSRFDVELLINNMSSQIFQPRNEKELKIIENGFRPFKRCKPVLMGWCASAAISCNLLPWFTYWNDGMIVLAWYPFVDISRPPWFGIVYTQQFLAIAYISLIGTFTDIIAAGFLSFMGTQCDLICYRLKNLYVGSSEKKQRAALIECVGHYRHVTRYLEIFEKVFGKIFFAQLFASTSSLVMDFFLLSLSEPGSFRSVYLAEYQIALTIMLLVPCWFSTEMTRKSEAIPLAAYSCEWTSSTKCFKKELTFFIQKAQYPMTFSSALYFQISVETFVKIIKSSFSYYAVLHSMDIEKTD